MGLKIVVLGTDDEGEETREVIHEDEGSVTKVRVLTRRGESATVPIEPDEGDIALTFEYLPAGQLHVSDVDLLKPGYQPNQTGEDVAATEEKLAEIRGTGTVNESFTQEAADAAAEAEEANAGTPEEPEPEPEPEPEAEQQYT